ncbi:hypothetical protein SH449x_001639 [Pirellulaceae bacterium SH449]
MKALAFVLIGTAVLLGSMGCTGIRVVHRGGHGMHDPYSVGCDSCGHQVTSPLGCNTGACGPGLLQRVGDRLRAAHCNSGCGEVYWDEQINEPRVCDPCSFHGEYVGGGDCGRCPGGLARIRELWGFRYSPSDCSTCAPSSNGSCQTCSTPSSHYEHSVAPSHEPATPARRSEPTPAKRPEHLEPTGEIRSTVTPRLEPSARIPPNRQRTNVASRESVRTSSHYR